MSKLYTAIYFSGDRQQYRHRITTVIADDAEEARRKISFQLGTVGRYCFYEDWSTEIQPPKARWRVAVECHMQSVLREGHVCFQYRRFARDNGPKLRRMGPLSRPNTHP